MAMNKFTFVFLAIGLMGLSGCASLLVEPEEQIVGQWRTQVGGFPVTVAYGEETVQVANYQPVSYEFDGNELTFEHGGSQTRIVAFPSSDEMVQTDPVTGTEHRFVRVQDEG